MEYSTEISRFGTVAIERAALYFNPPALGGDGRAIVLDFPDDISASEKMQFSHSRWAVNSHWKTLTPDQMRAVVFRDISDICIEYDMPFWTIWAAVAAIRGIKKFGFEWVNDDALP